jgi:hypothetical protein
LLTSTRRFKPRTHQPPAATPGNHALKNAPLSADLKSAEKGSDEIGVAMIPLHRESPEHKHILKAAELVTIIRHTSFQKLCP